MSRNASHTFGPNSLQHEVMNSHIDAVFLEALQIPAGAERDAFLDEACKDDAQMRRRLDAMLSDDAAADDFFDGPDTVAALPGAPPSPGGLRNIVGEKPRDMIGRYKLLEKIGEGGFGTVWMAEQMEPVTRRVALKIIKPGMDSREVIGRFEQERQALAMMDHPNIAKVFDAGATDRGRPYFVMELVRGVKITDHCDQANLPMADRLQLFITVCQAVQHAHQKGIIHRDLKPSNILVTSGDDGQPVSKIIDFGVAKAIQPSLTDATVYTRFEQMIGTPAYMAPEQAGLGPMDIDTRSDVYALGVVLYELLTGRPPFDPKELLSAGLDEMRRVIREVEPPKPSSKLSTVAGDERTTLAEARHIVPAKLSRMVEPDLDWIVMKAIEKDRSRRYETVNGLALDIQRFLSHEPVSAGPPTARYRFRKFARRNKTALRVTAGVAVLLVAATIVSSWLAVRATTAEKLANDRLEEKELALKDAGDISTFLGEVFQSPDPSGDGRMIKVADLLDRAAKKLETELASQPARRAKLHGALGRSYHALGLYGEAIPIQEKVRDYFLAALGPEHSETLWAELYLADSYSEAGRWREALKLGEEVLTLRRKSNGPEHPETIAAMNNLANSFEDAGRQDEALKMREEVLRLRRKVNGPEAPDTLKAMGNLALSYHNGSRREEALKLREEMLPLSRSVNGPEHPDTLSSMGNLARSYRDAGRLDEALKLREALLPLSRKINGPEHPDTLAAMTNLASSWLSGERKDEALKMQEEVLTLKQNALGPEHPDTLLSMLNLTDSYRTDGRIADSIRLGEELLTLSRKALGPEHRHTLAAMAYLADSYYAADRRDEALKLREEVLPLSRKVNGPEHADTLAAMGSLAESLQAAVRLDEAIKLLEELLPLSRKVNGQEHRHTLTAMHNLAHSYTGAGRNEEALKMKEEVLTLTREVLGPEHPGTIKAMHNLATSCHDAGRREEALKLREEVLALSRKVNGPEHPDTLRAMGNLAISLFDGDRHDEALKLREELLSLSININGPEHRSTLLAMSNLAVSRDAAGRLAEAIKLQEQSLEIERRVLPPNHGFLALSLGNLAGFYEKDGRNAEAEALRKELTDKGNPPAPPPAPAPVPAPEPNIAPEAKPQPHIPAIMGTLVAADSEWRWLHPTDGKDPAETTKGFHTGFFLREFDDSTWKTGKDSDAPDAGFGYGLLFKGVNIGKPDDVRHRKTAWFRHRFVTGKQHVNLELRCQRDDGIIVYLDGKEVIRDNVAPGADSWLLPSLTAMDRENDGVVHRHAISGTLAVGTHLLAISVHNTAQPSSDLRLGGVTLVELQAPKK